MSAAALASIATLLVPDAAPPSRYRPYDQPHGINGRFYGIIHAMKTTIDSAGRLVIPKDVRREAGLEPGIPLEVRWREGRVEIEPASLPVKLVKKGRLVVARARRPVPKLTAKTVERTRAALRRERGGR